MPLFQNSFQNFLIFGASGHLAEKYIFPALDKLSLEGISFNLYGYGRKPATEVNIPPAVKYFSGPYNSTGVRVLTDSLHGNTIFYFALPSHPSLLKDLLLGLHDQHLLTPSSRLIFEKPFGSNYQTAQKLFSLISRFANPEQVFLVDHYLTKDLVKNIISLRFANPIFQNNWNSNSIAKIEINALESIGIEGRGEYYDQTGALKDMVQNHCLQLLTLLTISEPKNLTQLSLRREKLKVLKSLRLKNLKLGQYHGYLQEEYVIPSSQTETYVELTLNLLLDNWSKVPLVITTGKKLPKKQTEIVVTFKKPHLCLWGDQCSFLSANQLILNLHPENQISLSINTEFNPSQNLPQPHHLKLGIADISTKTRTAYENVLLDVVAGSHLNMPTFSEILLQWQLIDSLEKLKSKTKLVTY